MIMEKKLRERLRKLKEAGGLFDEGIISLSVAQKSRIYREIGILENLLK